MEAGELTQPTQYPLSKRFKTSPPTFALPDPLPEDGPISSISVVVPFVLFPACGSPPGSSNACQKSAASAR